MATAMAAKPPAKISSMVVSGQAQENAIARRVAEYTTRFGRKTRLEVGEGEREEDGGEEAAEQADLK